MVYFFSGVLKHDVRYIARYSFGDDMGKSHPQQLFLEFACHLNIV